MVEFDSECTECQIYEIHQEVISELEKDQLSDEIVKRMAETYKILGDPSRLKILHLLSRRELCVCDIAELLDKTVSAVSHQLRLLRNLNLVRFEKRGKKVFYRLDDQHILNFLTEGLKHIMHT